MTTQDKGIDVIAYDNVGRAILVAEVKSRLGTSEKWAASFRRNMLAHGTVPSAPFFLIATPERLYFWKQDDPSLTDHLPELTIDTAKEFRQYFADSKTPQTISEQALELLVLSWLTQISSEGVDRVKRDPSLRWLVDSGLLNSLDRARIEMNPA